MLRMSWAGCAIVALSLAVPGWAQVREAAASPGTVTSLDASTRGSVQGVSPLQRVVSLNLTNVRLGSALDAIQRQAGIALDYTPVVVPVGKLVTVHLDSVTVAQALEAVLAGTGVHAEVTPSGRVMLVTMGAQPDTGYGVIAGILTDSSSGRGVDGVVMLSDTGAGAPLLRRKMATDSGAYWFDSVAVGVYALRVRRVGYRPASRVVEVQAGQPLRVDFSLRPTPTQLDAIVVTATGRQRRMDLGNDITILNADSIVKTQPITNVTQLLEGRVPGLQVVHSSGSPGAPSRLVLRGPGSALSSNDPIVIVDGVRIFSAVSDSQSANLASFGTGLLSGAPATAPSALDQIDPNTIANVEVFKGPSAATMYGPDAANGVIVITTKKGRPGPARWTAAFADGMNYMPGKYPDGIYRWGTSNMGGRPVICMLSDPTCHQDSIVTFQALNDPKYTILGRGHNTSASLGVSGGANDVTYQLTGSTDRETGLLRLPAVSVAQYQQQFGGPPPSWMQRPDQLSRWTVSAGLSARLDERTNVSLTSSLTQQTQQTSNLGQDLTSEMGTYVDRSTGAYYQATGMCGVTCGASVNAQSALIPDFYKRVTDDANNLSFGGNLSWQPRSWLTVSSDAGVNVINRHDQIFLPVGVLLGYSDSGGELSDAHGSVVTSSANVGARVEVPLALGFRLQLAAGANYTNTAVSDLQTDAKNLVLGTSSIDGAGQIVSASQAANTITSLGWYFEPNFVSRRFSISTGFRVDGSTSFGTHVALPVFPKLGASYDVSDERWFPFKRFFNALRIRGAYGQAGVWPSAVEQYRLYQPVTASLDSGVVSATTISTLGNTQLRPERSSEAEGGFDADVLDDRLSVAVTVYRKTRYDALMQMPLPPSVYGGFLAVTRNVGTIRNTGTELSLTAMLVRSDPVTWSVSAGFSADKNVVVALGQGVQAFYTDVHSGSGSRVAAGYPLNGFWVQPIVGYYDANHDGIIEPNEIQVGDTAVFVGASYPNWQGALSTQLTLFRGAVTASANFTYQAGLTQMNQTLVSFFNPGLTDPSSSQGQQAAAVAAADGTTAYGLVQTVNTLRLNSLSVAYNFPRTLARSMGADAVSVLLEGTNLGLWTNYHGKDPDVNAYPIGNTIADTGVLPTPRTWLFTVRAAY